MESYSSLQTICVQVFSSVSKTTSVFVVPLFMMRIVFSNLLGEGSKVFSILKVTILYFCLVSAFPIIIEILFAIPEAYLPKYEYFNSLAESSPNWSTSSIIPFAVDRILEVLLAGLYWLAYYLHIFFMIVMCSMAPIVFLSSTLLGLGLGLEIFLGLLIVGSSWPIIWFGFDQVHQSLISAQSDQFGAKCLELLLTLFKGLAPVAFAGLAIKSPAGRAITSAVKAAVSATGLSPGAVAPRSSSTESLKAKDSESKPNQRTNSRNQRSPNEMLSRALINNSQITNRLLRAKNQNGSQQRTKKGTENENP